MKFLYCSRPPDVMQSAITACRARDLLAPGSSALIPFLFGFARHSVPTVALPPWLVDPSVQQRRRR